MRALLDRNPSAIDERDSHGRTALHWAAIGGSASVATLLLDRGVDVDSRAELGMTPLHWASMAGKAETVDLLLRRGADIRALDVYGMTPLHEAATAEVVRVLVARGAPVSAKDQRGMTPLHMARRSKVAQALFEAHADPLGRSSDGRRPMDMATEPGPELDSLVIYAARAAARVRDEHGKSTVELRNVSDREVGPLTLAAESPACDVAVSPPSLARLDPGQLFPVLLSLTRRAGVSEGTYSLRLTVTSNGRAIGVLEARVDTTRAETPEDRGMMRLGRMTIRRAPSRLQYLAFALVPIIVGGLWLLRRRRR